MCALAAALNPASYDYAGWDCSDDTPSPSVICGWGGVSCSDDSSVTRISVDHSGLTGTLPTKIGSLSSLTGLYLSFNSLTGTVPANMGGMNSLARLSLTSNKLTGTVPTEFCSLTKLTYFYVDSSGLTCYPACLTTVTYKSVTGLSVCTSASSPSVKQTASPSTSPTVPTCLPTSCPWSSLWTSASTWPKVIYELRINFQSVLYLIDEINVKKK